MDIDKIKDIVIARLAFIASNAEEIARTARACEDTGNLDKVALNGVMYSLNDCYKNLKSLFELFNALEPKEKTDE